MRVLVLSCAVYFGLGFQSSASGRSSVVRSAVSASPAEMKALALGQPFLLCSAVAAAVVAGDDMTRGLVAAAIAGRCLAAVLSDAHSIARGYSPKKENDGYTFLGGPLTTAVGENTNHLLMTMEIDVKPGRMNVVKKLLSEYFEQVGSDHETQKQYLADDSNDFPNKAISAAQVDPNAFVITTRFRTASDTEKSLYVAAHHASLPFIRFTESLRPFLAEPARLYLVDEVNGRLGNARYPFGPGGEGGRDDSIYSSPANLDGSQIGSKLGVEAARDIDLASLSD